MKPILTTLIILSIFVSSISSAGSTNKKTDSLELTCVSAVLMEGNTGKIIYSKDPDKELIPASITKIMTLILIFEALDRGSIKLTDTVTVSETAASMGGSQVFLEPNETQTVNDMIKCISIASANDAAVAMAEKIAGSEQEFVAKMNEKAKSLGMHHTSFKNCSGLDDNIESGHYSSAKDVALMSRELITKHPQISKYSTVWMDKITHKTKKGESEFGLTNTNKLVRFYNGITGLKTGSTSKAKYCLSATAKRNGLDLIAVVMAAPDFRVRFSQASSLLDYGFAKCKKYEDDYKDLKLSPIPIENGITREQTPITGKPFSYTFTEEFDAKKIKRQIILSKKRTAPIKKGAVLGSLRYTYNNEVLGEAPLYAPYDIKKADYVDTLFQVINAFFRKR